MCIGTVFSMRYVSYALNVHLNMHICDMWYLLQDIMYLSIQLVLSLLKM